MGDDKRLERIIVELNFADFCGFGFAFLTKRRKKTADQY
jgi:hypothetical protein